MLCDVINDAEIGLSQDPKVADFGVDDISEIGVDLLLLPGIVN